MWEDSDLGDQRIIIADDLPKLCRSCLCEVHRDYFSLEGFYLDRKIVDIFKNVTSIEVDTDDNLPKKLCTPCYNHIIKFDIFKNKVLESERQLAECVNGIFYQREILIKHVFKSELVNVKSEEEHDFDQENVQDYENGFDQINDSEDEILLLDRLKREQKFNIEVETDQEVNNSDAEKNCERVESDEPQDKSKVKQKKRVRKKGALDGKRKKRERRKEPCPECGKILFTYRMENHMRTHTKEKPYGCEKCGAQFSERSNLNRHLKIHGSERPYTCKTCGKGFLRPSSRAIHEVTAHNSERTILCPLCGRLFKHQYVLYKHMANVHEHPKAFLCSICGNGYSSKTILKNHQRVHTGEKNYKCSICDKKFRFTSTLKTHELVHSGEKPLSCPICNKQFRQHSHLNTHIRGQHSTDRPYKCSYCSKTFKQSCNLTVHTRIHTGETPYRCDVCEKGFYDSSSMKKHRKGHFEKTNLAVKCNKMEVNEDNVKDDSSS